MSQAKEKMETWDTLQNFSTDEQVVGTWIDGKPLYSKTITDLPVAKSITLNFGATSVIKFAHGLVRCESNQWFPINSTYVKSYISPDGNGMNLLQIDGSDYRTINEGFVVAVYTKTTD